MTASSFVKVRARVIEFEDGTVSEVPDFEISTRRVTIGDFIVFQEATGYTTSAERLARRHLVLDNELVEGVDYDKRLGQTAFCLSHKDAMVYCAWRRVRLPSEAEWLAAALVDDDIVTRAEYAPLVREMRTSTPGQALLDILGEGKEITATMIGGRCVLRSGPRYYRKVDWRETAKVHRILLRPDEWDLTSTFRVCRG